MSCECLALSVGNDADRFGGSARKQAAFRPLRPLMDDLHLYPRYMFAKFVEFGDEDVVMPENVADAAGRRKPPALCLAPRFLFRTDPR